LAHNLTDIEYFGLRRKLSASGNLRQGKNRDKPMHI